MLNLNYNLLIKPAFAAIEHNLFGKSHTFQDERERRVYQWQK